VQAEAGAGGLRVATAVPYEFPLRGNSVEVTTFDTRFPNLLPACAFAHYQRVVLMAPEDLAALQRAAPGPVVRFDDLDRAVLVVTPTLAGPCRGTPAPAPVSSTAADGSSSAAAWDGDPATSWTGEGWIEARWAAPLRLTRVEIRAAAPLPGRLRYRLQGKDSSREWCDLEAHPLRPTRPDKQLLPHGQHYVLFAPEPAFALRLSGPEGRWALAEVQVATLNPGIEYPAPIRLSLRRTRALRTESEGVQGPPR